MWFLRLLFLVGALNALLTDGQSQSCPATAISYAVASRKGFVVLDVRLAVTTADAKAYMPGEQTVLKVSSPTALSMVAYRVAPGQNKNVPVETSPPEYYFSNVLSKTRRARKMQIKVGSVASGLGSWFGLGCAPGYESSHRGT
jgi:hypothetical protein